MKFQIFLTVLILAIVGWMEFVVVTHAHAHTNGEGATRPHHHKL